MEASYFTAYKCQATGIVTNQDSANIIFSYMTLIDNGFGVS